ncbi:MAG: hypothetical protein U0457_07960 [Candidatus Sericytochromatia bacterium]
MNKIYVLLISLLLLSSCSNRSNTLPEEQPPINNNEPFVPKTQEEIDSLFIKSYSFSVVDKNKNNSIDLDEFLAMNVFYLFEFQRQNMIKDFYAYDKNKNNLLSDIEYGQWYSKEKKEYEDTYLNKK